MFVFIIIKIFVKISQTFLGSHKIVCDSVPGVPKKNATDLKNSNTSCFKLQNSIMIFLEIYNNQIKF